MIEIETSSGQEAIITPCLRILFEWRTDHWKHEMISCGTCGSIPRLWSIEGGHALDDPARVSGPIYQQIDVRRDPRGVARALLVGQAGPHHFSAAFEVHEKPDGIELDVDVADRCPVPVEALAATYLIEASTAELRHSDGSATLAWHNPDSRLVFEAEPPSRIAASEASMGTIRLQALAAIDPSTRTHRLRYRWRWAFKPSRPIWDHTA